MTPELWNLYLKLQTVIAYPPGSIPTLKNEHAILEAGEFYRALVKQIPVVNPRILLVGPAGVNEIEAVKRSTTGPTTVLTVHEMEAGLYHDYTVHCADMHNTLLPNASFDLIYASNVLEHAFAPYIALMELRRVLAPGGLAYYTLPSFAGVEGGIGPFHLHCLDAAVWRELLHKTGYEVLDVKFTPPEAATSVAVQELLARSSSEEDFAKRTGCAHYSSFTCRAVPPPTPHDQIFNALVAHHA